MITEASDKLESPRSHPMATMGIFALVLMVIIGSGSYFSSQRQTDTSGESGVRYVAELFGRMR